MAEVKANHRLVSTVKLARVLRGQPSLRALMKPAMWKKVDDLAKRIEAITSNIAEIEEMGASTDEAVFDATHKMLVRLLKGIRYVWEGQTVLLSKLEPLQVGENEKEDFDRLTFLAGEVAKAHRPKFVWVEDFTAAMVKEQLAAHQKERQNAAAAAGGREKAAQLRALRPEAEKLWRAGKVERWVEVNADNQEEAVAMGHERRHRPRKAADKAGDKNPPDKSQQNGTGTQE